MKDQFNNIRTDDDDLAVDGHCESCGKELYYGDYQYIDPVFVGRIYECPRCGQTTTLRD